MAARKPKHSISEPGLVLRSYPSGDHDLVLHVLLQHSGKRCFFLHSGKKNRKKYPTLPEVFEMGHFEFVDEARDMLSLGAYFPKNSHRKIREDLDNFLCSSVAFECLDLLVQDRDPLEGPLCFQLGNDFLTSIEMTQDSKNRIRALYFFLVELIGQSGYLDPDDFDKPSRNQMLRLFKLVEEASGKKLKSLGQFVDYLGTVLRKSEVE